jgi:two-component system response regulator PilR (NtrC family)
MSRILLVDDEPSILSVLSTLMRSQGFEVEPVLGGDKAKEILASDHFDLMISDIRMSPVDGIELLKYAKSVKPGMSAIMITAYASVETAVEAMKLGAFDYVTKPFKVDELLITVQRALEYRRAISENEELKAQIQASYGFENMVAESSDMRKICDMVMRVAPTDQTVLIGGESGTGKEVIAKAIHANSVRKKKPFVPINCAALPEQLLESELFGHVKGSFTGASSDKEGLFETADGGSIFLDEIGSMPKSLQGKLLRVLQEREVRKVGGTKTRKIDVRVVAASNEDMEDMIAKGDFREDLFYRLSVIPIHLSPLRNRKEDILPLVYHFMRQIYQNPEEMPTIDTSAQVLLENYAWPGNVRELENAIKHACTFVRSSRIVAEDLPVKIRGSIGAEGGSDGGSGTEGADGFMGKSLKAFLRQKEAQYIATVISYHGGDKESAAKALKISLATLYRKLPEPNE